MKKISVHPASEENQGFLLWRVSTLWSNATATALKPFGLTHPHFILLAIMDRLKGKGASQEELAKQAILDLKITTHLLRSLQVKGLIDLSQKFPQITIAGADLLEKVFPAIESSDAAFFASLENSNMVTALQTLARANFSKKAIESSCV
jgi:DNA-binding MarR family transcriptional regulator